MGEAGIAGLKAALGLSVSMISSEHFFSAGMSSPWSVAKFAKSPEDKRQVWQLWGEAAGASLAFAVVIGVILGDMLSFVLSVAGAIAVSLWMWWDYKRALDGGL